MIPISVVIPAHNEEGVIGALLRALTADALPGELEIIVACNGCTDRTAEVARTTAPEAKVVEIPIPSKAEALNAGDEMATRSPRFYVDADVMVDLDALRRTAEVLANDPAVLCAAPEARYNLGSLTWPARSYFRTWLQIPYHAEERVGGVYGLSAQGRQRFDRFPPLTADDQFVLQQFAISERRCLKDCSFEVHPPTNLRDLLKTRARVYRGNLELERSGLNGHGRGGGSGRALLRLAADPQMWPSLAVYTTATTVAKLRARRASTGWERDDSSRDRNADGHRFPRIGYVVSNYPKPSHTFIQDEIRELRRLGVGVETFSLHRTPDSQLLSDEDRSEASRTTSLRPVGPAKLLRCHLRVLLRHPFAYISTLRSTLTEAPSGPRGKLWQLFYFAEAVLLFAEARSRAVTRLHAHLANVGADLAWIATSLGRKVEPGRDWNWSFTMHGPAEFYAVERFNLAAKVHHASRVICISDFCRSQLMMLSDPADWDKLEVVHCGVDIRSFRRSGSSRPVGTVPVVTCVGRLCPEKGQHLLLESLAILKSLGERPELRLVGDGPSRLGLERRALELGIVDQVTFLGAVGHHEIPDLIAGSDIFCLPSFAEGIPVVLMEAMSSGLAVITTPVAGITELVRHNETGLLVRPGRADELAAAIRLLLGDPKLRDRLGDAAREMVASDYELTTNVAKVRDALGLS